MAGKVPSGSTVTVADVTLPAANGMSSETILFDATWDGEHHPLVARVAPTESTMPVFPTYDLESQFHTMAQVREHSAVPVPAVYWSESDPDALGAPFFVMERISGDVPPDVMPYNFGSWVTEASPEQRKTLQRSSVDVLAQLHAIDKPGERFDFLRLPNSGTTAREAFTAHIAEQRTYYEWVVSDGIRSPLIERALDWIEENNPADDSPAVLCWGDSRIGNVMYQDFAPVAVLDWEMATLGPREMDLAGWHSCTGSSRTSPDWRTYPVFPTSFDCRISRRPTPRSPATPHTIWSSTLPMPHCVRRSSCGESRPAP